MPGVAAAGVAFVKVLSAEVVTNIPASDTFISIHWGGPNGSGPDMVAGTQGQFGSFSPNRALLKFDLSNIPQGAQIESVSLEITVTRSPATPPSTFNLHRLLVDWSEASSTWEARTSGTPWEAPGAEAGSDYSEAVSGAAAVGNLWGQTYIFASTPEMVGDVTRWITNSAENYGWLIRTPEDETPLTARRIGSRDGSVPPRLIIEFTPAPPRPAISSVGSNSGQICVEFNATAGKSYVLERRAAVDTGSWTPVATLPPTASGPATLCDPLATGNGFYRIGEF